MASSKFTHGGALNFLTDLLVRAVFGLFRLLPYRTGLSLAGWSGAYILAPLFGANRRIRKNLAHVWPELGAPKTTRLCAEVSDNSARLMLESFNPPGFIKHARRATFKGAGKDMLLKALAQKRPVILVSGHFGNYQVLRVLLADMGHATAAIYRPMNNAFTNRRYIDNMNRIAAPNFARGISGTKALLTHLRKGGAIALLNDQAASEGITLSFMGKPARSMTSAAEFALKYDAVLFPYYGIRQPNKVDFEVIVESPIAPDTPAAMTQALNDSLESRVRAHPGQWFWIHRRWKGL